jgi:hypothetical protein
MIRVLEGLPDGVLGVEATGKVTDDDYEQVLIPAVQGRLQADGKLRVVYVLGEGFEGWTGGAMWDDAKLGIRNFGAWEKIAVVTDNDWIRNTIKAFGWMVPGDVRLFGPGERDDAVAWAAA